MTRKSAQAKTSLPAAGNPVAEAVRAIKSAVLRARAFAAVQANRGSLALNFGVGRYVSERTRAGVWGTGAVEAICERLQKELPGLRGFGVSNVKNMRQFYEAWAEVFENRQTPSGGMKHLVGKKQDEPIRQPVAGELVQLTEISIDISIRQTVFAEFPVTEFLSLGFSHHMEILSKTKTLEERVFYIVEAARNIWDKRTLHLKLAAKLFRHQGRMPSNFARAIPDEKLALRAIRAFKDEYTLEMVNLESIDETDADDVDERVLENAIVANIRRFILEFGRDFSFIGNQYRVEAAGRELFIDLLFFNRGLNALVAVELKRGAFKPAYLGQLNLYLQALDDRVRKPHENPPVGIVLCQDADRAFVEYAVRDYSKPMGVAVYRTADEMPERLRNALPPVEELARRLQTPSRSARRASRS